MNSIAFPLFIISVGAFIVPMISNRIGFPVIVGEILYGMVLTFILETSIVSIPLIDSLAQLGFIFLMFLAGLEINFSFLKPNTLKYPILFTILLYSIAYGLLFVFSYATFFYLICLTATSVGILFIILKSNNLEQTKYGQNLLWTATFSEIVTIFCIIIFEVSHKHEQISLSFFIDLSKFFIILLIAYLLIKVLLAILWRFPNIIYTLDTSSNMSELAVRLSFLVMLTMVALADYFHLELILGAFLGGMVLSFVFRNKEIFEAKLKSIGYGFFIPFFFIKIGLDYKIDLDTILPMLIKGITFYGVLILVRLLAMLFLSLQEWSKGNIIIILRSTLASSFIMATPLTLLIVLGEIGLQAQTIDQSVYNIFIITAVVSGSIGPLFFNLLYPKVRT